MFTLFCALYIFPVSYTHLDVYKRQGLYSIAGTGILSPAVLPECSHRLRLLLLSYSNSGSIPSSVLISTFFFLLRMVQPRVLLIYFISAASIFALSLPVITLASSPYIRTGTATVLKNLNLVSFFALFLRYLRIVSQIFLICLISHSDQFLSHM